MKRYPDSLARYDSDGDQNVSPGEIPLVVRLEVERN